LHPQYGCPREAPKGAKSKHREQKNPKPVSVKGAGRNHEIRHAVKPCAKQIEDPCGKLQEISDRKETVILLIRSLTPPQAAANALAVAVQSPNVSMTKTGPHFSRFNSHQHMAMVLSIWILVIPYCFGFKILNLGLSP
jgi:hypothetical protein